MVAIGNRIRNRLDANQPPDHEEGQGLVEYSLTILLIALVVIAALSAYGGTLAALYDSILARLPF